MITRYYNNEVMIYRTSCIETTISIPSVRANIDLFRRRKILTLFKVILLKN